jgi:hypothetical protein
MAGNYFLDYIRCKFGKGQTGRTDDPIISVGGMNVSGSYVGMSYDATGNLFVTLGGAVVNVSGGGGAVSQSGSWTTAIRDSSGNPVLATNTNPIGTEQGWITRIAAAQALQGGTVQDSPVLVGGEARTTDGTTSASATQRRIILDSLGKLVTLPGAINDLHLDGAVSQAGVIATALIANQGSGKRIAMQSLLVTCSGSATVQVIISGGPNNRTFGFAAPGGGFALNAGGAPLYITSASTALSVAGDVTSTMDIFASGYSLGN